MIFRLLLVFLLSIFLHSSELGEAFRSGKAKGHVGTLVDADFVGDGTYLDLSASLSYRSGIFYGYDFYASAWLNPKLYEMNRGWRDNKTWLEFPELGIGFFNDRLNFGFDAGRFSYTRDWIKNYVQGISFYHAPTQEIDYEITWINRSSLIEYYKVEMYHGAEHWLGGLWASGNFKIPNTTAVISPYIYSVADLFWASAAKASMDFYFPTLSGKLEARATLLFYVAYHNRQFRGDSVMYWSDLIWKDTRNRFEAGGGILAVSSYGAKDLSVFGQNTDFINTTGIFEGNMTTLYAFGKFNFKYDISLKTSMRTTISTQGGVIFGFEAQTGYYPIKNLKLGLDLTMVAGADQFPQTKGDQYGMRTYVQFFY